MGASTAMIDFLPARRFSTELPWGPFSGYRTKRGDTEFTVIGSIPVAIMAGAGPGAIFLRIPSSSFRPATVRDTATMDVGIGIGTTTTVVATATTDPGIGTTTVLAMVTTVPGTTTTTLVGMLPRKRSDPGKGVDGGAARRGGSRPAPRLAS